MYALRGEQHDALHDRVIAIEYRIDDQLAEAGYREHLLGEHCAGKQRAEFQRAQRDDRNQRIAQRVLEHDDALVEPLARAVRT
jgi:hypothetical protein